MALTKYATFEDAQVLDVKGSPTRSHTASLDRLSDFHDYRTDDGYLYVRLRAISSRVNKNNDGWPSIELAGGPEVFERHAKQSSTGFTVETSEGNPKYGFSTFLGKPNFIDHNNSDPKRSRGVVVDAKLRVLPIEKTAGKDNYWGSESMDPEHAPPTEIELLIEVDAKSFPTYAKAIRNGDIDGFSMGCFVAGTPITLSDGTQRNIEQIKIGDWIITHRGNHEQVTDTMVKHYEGQLYHVETYGQSARMSLTEEHPVWTKRGWVEARHLTPDDHVLTPRIQSDEIGTPPPWPRLLGYYLAEGNLGYDKKRYPDGRPVFAEWNFHKDEEEYIEDVKQSLVDMGYSPCGPYVKNNCATVRCNSPKLAHYLQYEGGEHSWAKKLDLFPMNWSTENKKALLDCYFKGDGHYRNGKIEISTASENLAHQIQTLATSVGYRATPPTLQHSPSAAHKRAKYSLYVTPKETMPTKKFYVDDEGLWRKITKISSEDFVGTVYNFDVDGDDSYVAADIAVHNCDVSHSKCSHCGHIATNPEEYCSHILMKGAHHDFKTADGKRISRKSYENCYGIHFFEISAVFDPADETALAREIRASVEDEGLTKTAENPLPQSFEVKAPENIDTMRQEHKCPECGETMDGETCDVCGYIEPPKGLDNPDLTKAKELQQAMEQGSQEQVQQDVSMAQQPQQPSQQGPPGQQPGGPPVQGQQPGSYLQTRNRSASASVMDDMRWSPQLNPRVAARIKTLEKPLLPGGKPATNDPVTVSVTKNPTKPVTAAMKTAQDLIEAAQHNHKGDTMSTQKTADGPTGPEAAPDARVDATGIGGVIEPNNESASKADSQVTVTDTGSTGVTDVEADKTESLPTASEGSDDSGFDATKTTDDSGPTSTYGDSDGTEKGFTDSVTNESLEGNQNKDSSVKKAYDSKPFFDQPGLSGGSANKGTEPVDPVGKAQDRVDVLQATSTPDNNSGPTSQWTGTDGHGHAVERQQEPVTREISDMQFDGFTSHIVAAIKLADLEVDLGLVEKDEKYPRIASLDEQSDAEISAQMDMLSRVKTAGTKKLAQQRTAGITRMPGAFGKTTAATKRFDSVLSSDETAPVAEDTLDAAIFS